MQANAPNLLRVLLLCLGGVGWGAEGHGFAGASRAALATSYEQQLDGLRGQLAVLRHDVARQESSAAAAALDARSAQQAELALVYERVRHALLSKEQQLATAQAAAATAQAELASAHRALEEHGRALLDDDDA